MENPPDLLVAFTSDDSCQDKKKLVDDEVIDYLHVEKKALEYEVQQLRKQINERRQTNNEFDDQAYLLQQRVHEEIQTVIHQHKQLIQQVTNDLSIYVTNMLQKRVENIESLRLLHQKELCAHSPDLTDCIRQQSCEMTELCSHLLDEQRQEPMNLFEILNTEFQSALNQLQTSFDSKVNYLHDIHSSTIDKLNTKHTNEIDEIKCELNLACNR
ncbi:unnamed protein product [Adineta ricciae]|uniref:Uncharacterized protein n=1 Tax=Adineta ricciae TaxID=249248 RepID=A0A814R3D7_ADIRI|nr:unnamed protein product [Adineta ricciae]CAF1461026.1 unnamed protein product [Adineta ricciae]